MTTNRVRPKIVLTDTDAALQFYARVLDATEIARYDVDGSVVFAEIEIFGTRITLKDGDDADPAPTGPGPILDVVHEDPDAVAQAILDAGGSVVFEMSEQPFGGRWGRVRDPFGVEWLLHTQETMSPSEIQEVLERGHEGYGGEPGRPSEQHLIRTCDRTRIELPSVIELFDVRRSQALGLPANPAAALRLIARDRTRGAGRRPGQLLEGRRPKRLRPRVELVIHVTESDFTRDARGVARFEDGGPITLAHAREVLGHSFVTIRPVIDLAHQLPTDAYELTGSLRESVLLRTPVDCFPVRSRRTGGCRSSTPSPTTSMDRPVRPGPAATADP